MTLFKLCSYLFLYFSITACSSTEQVNLGPQSNHYYAKNFSHYEFTRNSVDSIKKPASTDQELMVSLLNRPIPEDQRMMLAFAERQASYLPDSTFIGIKIKGEKRAHSHVRASSQYAGIIAEDINGISINPNEK